MTKQETYDKAKAWLAQQATWASSVTGAYRQRSRSLPVYACSIGCLIADQDYRPWMEGKTVGDLVKLRPDLFDAAIETSFYGALQAAHDGAKAPAEWLPRLAAFAKRHRLQP